MYNQKLYKRLLRNKYGTFFPAVSLLTLFLSLTAVQASAGGYENKIHGAIKEMPGVGWPYGIWYLEDKRVKITEETAFKGDQSKAAFGMKIVAKGRNAGGVFVASEIEIRTDDGPAFADN